MKKLGILVLSFLFTSLFMVDVNATQVVTDPSNNIKMPYNLFVDSTNYVIFENMNGATMSYQIVDVSNNSEIVNYIDKELMPLLRNLDMVEEEFGKHEANTNESNNALADMNYIKEEIDSAVKSDNLKTLISDYNDSTWLSLTENIIPTANITKNKYYIVWIKTENGGVTTHEYHAYKAIDTNYYSNSNSNTTPEVENPETGIEHTILFVIVGTLILVGSGLVIDRNKESY
ncbi:MAG: LPXTG cell wall anchor domain-containing protein [Firmicutes bacterium]|nr:LPXTG cell wall anchor domain-containing protein [Bacillota bacterium]